MPELAHGSNGNVVEDAVNDAANLSPRTYFLGLLTGSVFTNIQKLFQELYFNFGRSSLFQKFFRYFTSSFFGSGVSSILFYSGQVHSGQVRMSCSLHCFSSSCSNDFCSNNHSACQLALRLTVLFQQYYIWLLWLAVSHHLTHNQVN